MTKQELKNYLIDECEYTKSRVERMSAMDMVDRYLRNNGIDDFTEDIVCVVEAAFGVKLEN